MRPDTSSSFFDTLMGSDGALARQRQALQNRIAQLEEEVAAMESEEYRRFRDRWLQDERERILILQDSAVQDEDVQFCRHVLRYLRSLHRRKEDLTSLIGQCRSELQSLEDENGGTEPDERQ